MVRQFVNIYVVTDSEMNVWVYTNEEQAKIAWKIDIKETEKAYKKLGKKVRAGITGRMAYFVDKATGRVIKRIIYSLANNEMVVV